MCRLLACARALSLPCWIDPDIVRFNTTTTTTTASFVCLSLPSPSFLVLFFVHSLFSLSIALDRFRIRDKKVVDDRWKSNDFLFFYYYYSLNGFDEIGERFPVG